MAFSTHGSLIVSGGADGAVRVWDGRTRTSRSESAVRPVPGVERGDRATMSARSPPRQETRTARSNCGMSPHSPQTAPRWSPIPEPVFTASISARDGQRIVSGSHDGAVRVWNVESRQQLKPQPMSVDGNPVLSVAFAHDQPWIVSGSLNGAVRVWDADRYEPIGAPLMGHKDYVPSVAISADDSRILSGSYDGNIQLWPTPKDLGDRLCDKLSANMTHQQWNDWVSSTDGYVQACPALPTPPDG